MSFKCIYLETQEQQFSRQILSSWKYVPDLGGHWERVILKVTVQMDESWSMERWRCPHGPGKALIYSTLGGGIDAELGQTSLLTPQPPPGLESSPCDRPAVTVQRKARWEERTTALREEDCVLIWRRCLFHLVLLPHYSISVSKHPHRLKLEHIFNMHGAITNTPYKNMD